MTTDNHNFTVMLNAMEVALEAMLDEIDSFTPMDDNTEKLRDGLKKALGAMAEYHKTDDPMKLVEAGKTIVGLQDLLPPLPGWPS